MDAIYQGLIVGKLDQKLKCLEVEYAIGRDIKPGQLDEMIHVLNGWSQSTNHLLNHLDTKVNQIQESVQEALQQDQLYQEQLKNAKSQAKLEDDKRGGRKKRF